MKKYICAELMEALKEKKAFIFDFDGTLASTDEILYQTLKILCKKYNYAYTRKEFELVRGKKSSEYFKQFKSVVGDNVDEKQMVEDYLNTFNKITLSQKLHCYKYVKELVDAFPDKTYCVASNNVQEFLEQRISDFGLNKLFKNIFACGSGYLDKEYVYKNIQQLIGVMAKDCVLFEDNQDYIKLAESFGFTSVAIVHENNKEIKADYYIDLRSDEKGSNKNE